MVRGNFSIFLTRIETNRIIYFFMQDNFWEEEVEEEMEDCSAAYVTRIPDLLQALAENGNSFMFLLKNQDHTNRVR